MIKHKHTLLLAISSLLALQIGSANACQVVGHTKSGEPLCMTTSDGAGQSFNDGRRFVPKAVQAARIAEMKRGGTMIGGVLVSPFVPGSKQDREWQAERKRRGF
ncbi:hypothetical protein ACNHKD_06090 [Methylocystis sp. JAN1]|uniref:hypothetical protein n=1 Tax=Methylocystis sp. JAN1 TaxID=3397211 RepID=UPI003FA1DE03